MSDGFDKAFGTGRGNELAALRETVAELKAENERLERRAEMFDTALKQEVQLRASLEAENSNLHASVQQMREQLIQRTSLTPERPNFQKDLNRWGSPNQIGGLGHPRPIGQSNPNMGGGNQIWQQGIGGQTNPNLNHRHRTTLNSLTTDLDNQT